MNFMFLGDVVGKGGRLALKQLIPELRREFNCQMVAANVENMAAGSGVTAGCLRELEGFVDIFTAGDHVWDQKGFDADIDRFPNFLRPANLASVQPGKGYGIFRNPAGGEVAMIVLQGKVFMRDSAYCPFETVENILKKIPPAVKNIFVDVHAEATSEKLAMAYFLDGKVTGVFGTHTHVPTADARILPGGTARQTDVGMCGGVESVLGRAVPDVLKKFRVGMPNRLTVVEDGPIRVDGVVVNYDISETRAKKIESFSRVVEI